MNPLAHTAARLVHLAYWYCTDFMVNLANLTGTSYNEANALVLLVFLPGLLSLLVGIRIGQWCRPGAGSRPARGVGAGTRFVTGLRPARGRWLKFWLLD